MKQSVDGHSVTSYGAQRILLRFHDQVVVVIMGELSIHFEFLNFCDYPETVANSEGTREPAVDTMSARTYLHSTCTYAAQCTPIIHCSAALCATALEKRFTVNESGWIMVR